MQPLRVITSLALVLLPLAATVVAPALAAVPGGIDITCDLPRTGSTNFRGAAVGQTDVKFKLWSAATAGTQIGSDYVVPMAALAVFKRHTEKYDSVTTRKAERINAVIGSDASPVLLPANGMTWLDVTVGSTTLGCDFAATGSLSARRRLHSVPFAEQGPPSVKRATGVVSISNGAVDPTFGTSGLPFRPRYVEINIGGIYQPDTIAPSIPARVHQSWSYNERDTGTTACLESRIYNDVPGDDYLNWTDKAVSLQVVIGGAGYSGPVSWTDDGFSVFPSGRGEPLTFR